MSQQRHIDQDDLALYALHLLSEAEAAQMEEHLAQCPECRAEAAALRGDMVAYAMTTEMHAPAASAKQRLFKQIAREKKVVPMLSPEAEPVEAEAAGQIIPPMSHHDPAKHPMDDISRALGSAARAEEADLDDEEDGAANRPGGVSRVLPWLGWPIAAGLAITSVSFYYEREQMRAGLISESERIATLSEQAARGDALIDALTDRGAMRVTLNETADKEPVKPKPRGRATYVPDKGMLIFLATDMAPLEPNKTYELWIIPATQGMAPIPAGTFHPDAQGDANVIMPTLPKGIIAKAFGVTIEQEGGSTVPTAPIILSGA